MLSGFVGTSSKSHQLVSTESKQPKHQMAHDFGMSFDHDVAAAEFVLEARVGPFGHGAFTVANFIGRLEVFLLAATRIVVDQGNMSQFAAVVVQLFAAVGSVHHIVQIGDPLLRDVRQRHGGAGLSCIEAEHSKAAMGTPQSAVSMCSLYPFQLVL